MDVLELRYHARSVECQGALARIFKEHLAMHARAIGAHPTRVDTVVFEGLIIGFQIFFSKAQSSLAASFLFKLYDFDRDGTISRDEVFEFIEHAKTSHIALLDEAEQATRRESVTADTERGTNKFMNEADTDRDGTVTKDEFEAWYARTVLDAATLEVAASQSPAQGARSANLPLREVLAQRFENEVAAHAFSQNSRMTMLKIRRLFSLRSDDLLQLMESLEQAAGARQVLTHHSFLVAASSSLSAAFAEVVAVEEKAEMRKVLVSIFAAFMPHDAAVDFISYKPVHLAVAELVSTRDRAMASELVFNTLTATSAVGHSAFLDHGSLTRGEMVDYLNIVLTTYNALVSSEAKLSVADIYLLAVREVAQLFAHLDVQVGEEPRYQRALFDEWFTTRVPTLSHDSISESATAIEKLTAMHAEITKRENSVAAREAELQENLRKMEQRERELQLLETGGVRKTTRLQMPEAVPLRSRATDPLLRGVLRLNPGDFSSIVSVLDDSMQVGYMGDAGVPRAVFMHACMRSAAQNCAGADRWVHSVYDIFLDQTAGGDGQASLLELAAAVALIAHPDDEQEVCQTLFDLVSPAQGPLAIGEFLEAAMPLAIIDWNATGRLGSAKASGVDSSTIISTIVQEVVKNMRALKLGDEWNPSQPISRMRFAAWLHSVLEAAVSSEDKRRIEGPIRSTVAKKYPSTASKLTSHTGRFQKAWSCCSCANRYSRTCCTRQDPSHIANWKRTHTYDAVRSEWHRISTAPLPTEAYPDSSVQAGVAAPLLDLSGAATDPHPSTPPPSPHQEVEHENSDPPAW